MKKILFNVFFLVLFSFAYSQVLTEVKVRVIDSDTKTGIEDVNVLIQEIMMTGKTVQFGIALFPSVPVRQVTIEVQKDGYLPKKEEINITNDKFNNTFSIELIKEKMNTVTIYGAVKAGSKRLGDVTVTLRIGNYEQKEITAKTGDYSFQVPKEKITTKIKLLFSHSRYAAQEREFEVLQSQPVKEVDPVVLSGAVDDEDLKLETCWDPHNKFYSGVICFDNQMGFNIELVRSNAYNSQGFVVANFFFANTRTNCTPYLSINFYGKSNPDSYDCYFIFRTIPENSMDKPRYAKISVLVEKCRKKVILLNDKNMFFGEKELW